jgi:hypothetical protein
MCAPSSHGCDKWSILVRADEVDYNEQTREINAQGNVHIEPPNTFTPRRTCASAPIPLRPTTHQPVLGVPMNRREVNRHYVLVSVTLSSRPSLGFPEVMRRYGNDAVEKGSEGLLQRHHL